VQREVSLRGLANTPLDDVFARSGEKFGKVISVNGGEPLSVGISALYEHNLLSVPLFDNNQKTYTNFLDLLDVLFYVINLLETNDLKQGEPTGFMDLVNVNNLFRHITCMQVANFSNRDPFIEMVNTSPLDRAVKAMSNPNDSIHRIPILLADGTLTGILSQSRVVRFLSEKMHCFDFAQKKVKDLKHVLYPHEAICVHNTDTVNHALNVIKDKKISAVGVVDKEGKLIGNFSVKDIRGFLSELTTVFGLHIYDFLKALPKKGDIGYPVCVTEETTVEELIAKLAYSGVHRVYVVDTPNHKPRGCISLTNILTLVNDAFKTVSTS